MPLDPSIYDLVGRGVKSVSDFDREALDLENARTADQSNALNLLLNKQKADEYTRSIADDNALREVVKGFGADPQANVSALFKAGRLKDAQAYQKAIDESAKTGAETTKTRVGAIKDQADAYAKTAQNYRSQLDLIDTPEQAKQWLQAQYSDPVFGAHMQSLGPFEKAVTSIPSDPEAFGQWRQRAGMGMEKFIQDQTAKRGQDKTAETAKAGQERMAADAAAGRAVQREANAIHAASLTKPFEVTGPDGAPLLVQQDKQGNITPVQGFGTKSGASKPLTDAQAKALLYGSRMQESDRIIGDLAARGVTGPNFAQQITGGDGITGTIATATASPEHQQIDQAQRDFINAVLRRESGAAIASSEFSNARKQYFVQPGDSPEVIAQKARNRALATQGMLAEVPDAQRNKIAPTAPKVTSGTDLGGGFKVK